MRHAALNPAPSSRTTGPGDEIVFWLRAGTARPTPFFLGTETQEKQRVGPVRMDQSNDT